VIVDVGVGGQHRVNGGVLVEKVRHENFDDDAGIGRADCFDGLTKMVRAAVGQIRPGPRR